MNEKYREEGEKWREGARPARPLKRWKEAFLISVKASRMQVCSVYTAWPQKMSTHYCRWDWSVTLCFTQILRPSGSLINFFLKYNRLLWALVAILELRHADFKKEDPSQNFCLFSKECFHWKITRRMFFCYDFFWFFRTFPLEIDEICLVLRRFFYFWFSSWFRLCISVLFFVCIHWDCWLNLCVKTGTWMWTTPHARS
jgi:hypothetical protein